jgi:hypothetical protein
MSNVIVILVCGTCNITNAHIQALLISSGFVDAFEYKQIQTFIHAPLHQLAIFNNTNVIIPHCYPSLHRRSDQQIDRRPRYESLGYTPLPRRLARHGV